MVTVFKCDVINITVGERTGKYDANRKQVVIVDKSVDICPADKMLAGSLDMGVGNYLAWDVDKGTVDKRIGNYSAHVIMA